jgi:hypothetical protein
MSWPTSLSYFSNHAAIYALQGSLAGFPLEQDLAEEKRAEHKREDKR